MKRRKRELVGWDCGPVNPPIVPAVLLDLVDNPLEIEANLDISPAANGQVRVSEAVCENIWTTPSTAVGHL